jgi:hypothetical protein
MEECRIWWNLQKKGEMIGHFSPSTIHAKKWRERESESETERLREENDQKGRARTPKERPPPLRSPDFSIAVHVVNFEGHFELFRLGSLCRQNL